MNCPTCLELERTYETGLSEYIEARFSEWFFLCPGVAARKNVDMERTRCELEEHRLVCVSANRTVVPPAREEQVYNPVAWGVPHPADSYRAVGN
jgi:hypothetical protein